MMSGILVSVIFTISLNGAQFGNAVTTLGSEQKGKTDEACNLQNLECNSLQVVYLPGGCHPGAGCDNTANQSIMIGGKNISSIIHSINGHLNDTRNLLNGGNISAIKNTLGLANEDLSLLEQKLSHIGSSMYKCIVSACGPR